MKRYGWIIAIIVVVLVNVLAHFVVVRWDVTDDHHYSLSQATKEMLGQLDEPIEITTYLNGDLNAGFRRLQKSTQETIEELGIYAKIENHTFEGEAKSIPETMSPIVIHERQQDGKTSQTTIYPYAVIAYKGKKAVVNLLQNNRGMSGEENLNSSIENLEYAFAEAIHGLLQKETPRIAFLEGHGELPEANVYDISLSLSRYFQVDRGQLSSDPHILDAYKAVIIADPQAKFSDADKFILDQFIMRGGRILWVMNGVQFSNDVLAKEGFTPVLALDLNLTDMLFHYGVRINPALLQDVQCLPIPVNVSSDPQQPNLQPMPWFFAPLLLTSQASPITKNVGQVSSTFVSPIDIVGGKDGIQKDILLATSSASRIIGTPAEVDLGEMNPDMTTFQYQYIPVAMSLEGQFPSSFAHRMIPEGIETSDSIIAKSCSTRQVVIASGSIIRNEIQKGKALPAGYDRYSGMQFGNRDFITNAVLYLTDDEGLINLRKKSVALRLLNDKRAHDERIKIQIISIVTPILLLALIGGIFLLFRRRRNIKK